MCLLETKYQTLRRTNMESFILITGLLLFSGTTTYDLHHKAMDAQKVSNSNTTVQVEKGFFSEDKRK
jgi:hypothetical protein